MSSGVQQCSNTMCFRSRVAFLPQRDGGRQSAQTRADDDDLFLDHAHFEAAGARKATGKIQHSGSSLFSVE
jgi:hypothetical protein